MASQGHPSRFDQYGRVIRALKVYAEMMQGLHYTASALFQPTKGVGKIQRGICYMQRHKDNGRILILCPTAERQCGLD